MASTNDLLADLDALLEPDRWQDFGPNGLQVPGAEEVSTVVTGVSATAALLEGARDEGAGLVLVHHGLFWPSLPAPLDPSTKRRLQLLFDADIALAAYHLPLDGHQEVGNNALLARALGATHWEPFARHRGAALGVAATLPDAIGPADLADRVRAATDREPLAFLDGPEAVRTIGIVSGAGGDHVTDAAESGLDAFVTGEPSERHMALAQELGIHFLAAGHYATETRGIRALGDRLAERFGVRHVFLDLPNPV
jgi:dinuclear metal center YbgI/SA1388 family protein